MDPFVVDMSANIYGLAIEMSIFDTFDMAIWKNISIGGRGQFKY